MALQSCQQGEDFKGRPSERCVIEGVEVRVQATRHSYMIWNLRGRHIKILNNFVDGGSIQFIPTSNQEGNQSYGGLDVLIAGNTVRNIGNACLNVGSSGGADTAPRGVIISNNFTENCKIGIKVSPALDPLYGPQNPTDVLIHDNVIINSWQSGVYIKVVAGTSNDGIEISENVTRSVGALGESGSGINLQGDSEAAMALKHSNTVLVTNNQINKIVGLNGHGIRVIQYPNVMLIGNTISDSEHSGIYAYTAYDMVVSNNQINDSGFYAVWVSALSKRPLIASNVIRGWGTKTTTAAILIEKWLGGVVKDNYFYRGVDEDEKQIVLVGDGSTDTVLTGNVTLHMQR